jgi:UDPglucose 6-dehydrogenase
MERICICGLGKMGRSIFDAFKSRGRYVVGYDHLRERTQTSLDDAFKRSDACIFIVQTPSLPDGSFSNEFLWDALTRFKNMERACGRTDYLYIVTSTTTPGSCDGFRQIVGNNLVYKPEFVRTMNPEKTGPDFLNPAILLIGEHNKESGDRAERIYRSIANVPTKRMSLIEAELAKITLNCALTMKISLANQLHLVAQQLGADSKKIMDAVGSDPRIGNAYLVPGWPYSGPCLPRDNRMFQYIANKVGIEAALSSAADRINDAISKRDF